MLFSVSEVGSVMLSWSRGHVASEQCFSRLPRDPPPRWIPLHFKYVSHVSFSHTLSALEVCVCVGGVLLSLFP